jgi:large subunit ribosomal protein L9
MEVILLERIEKLGQMGDVVIVKPGFARNFLLPQKKALRATEDNRRQFEDKRAQLEADNLDRRTDAESVAEKMDDVTVFLQRQAGDAGQLYGSVSARDIAVAVTEAGFTVNRSQVQLDRPIKAIGLYDVRVDLHPEVTINVTANVARSEEEAAVQAKTGRAVVHADEEDFEGEDEVAVAVAAAEEVFEEPADDIIEELVSSTTDDDDESDAADTGDDAPNDDGANADTETSVGDEANPADDSAEDKPT